MASWVALLTEELARVMSWFRTANSSFSFMLYTIAFKVASIS